MNFLITVEWGRLAAAQYLADHLWQNYVEGRQ